jgi:hypothetical protein
VSRHPYSIRQPLHSATAVPTISTRYDHALMLHIRTALHFLCSTLYWSCPYLSHMYHNLYRLQRQIHEAEKEHGSFHQKNSFICVA